MKITKKKALEETIKIWKELAKTGAAEKPDYAKKYVCSCPICEYYDKCTDRGGCCLNDKTLCGFNHEGAYRNWHNSTRIDTRKKFAKIILTALQKEYRKCYKK
jgi:hypothetical protein